MDVPELAKVRELLLEKYTNSILPDREVGVYPRLVLKLAMSNPERGLCEKYLEAIADNFGIEWAGSTGDDEEEDGTRARATESVHENKSHAREETLLNLLSSTSSHSITSSSSTNDTPPVAKPTPAPLPMDYSKQHQTTKQNLPDFDEFTRRFEALRKK